MKDEDIVLRLVAKNFEIEDQLKETNRMCSAVERERDELKSKIMMTQAAIVRWHEAWCGFRSPPHAENCEWLTDGTCICGADDLNKAAKELKQYKG